MHQSGISDTCKHDIRHKDSDITFGAHVEFTIIDHKPINKTEMY